MIARRILITGLVQGVYYRGWTVEEARSLGLSGWVRNLRSGEVEIFVMGSAEAVDELIARCRSGSPAAKVEDLIVEEAEPEPLDGFASRPTP